RERVAVDDRRDGGHLDGRIVAAGAQLGRRLGRQRQRGRAARHPHLVTHRELVATAVERGDMHARHHDGALRREDVRVGIAAALRARCQRQDPEDHDPEQPASLHSRTAGNRMTNTLPRPGSDSHRTSPPCARATWRTSGKPSPRPPNSRVDEPSPWAKSPKMSSSRSTGTPTPRSTTVTSTMPSSARAATVTFPPDGEYFTALSTSSSSDRSSRRR